MYDFHMHTTFSDGSKTPKEIFDMAKELNFKALSITDHDTVLGLGDAFKASRESGIPYIPALELTVKEDGIKLHVLAYGVNKESAEAVNYSLKLKKYMDEKSLSQIHVLRSKGLIDGISDEEFFEEAKGGPLYRAKFLKTLSNKGYFPEDEIMKRLNEYFGKEGYCYMEDKFPYMSFNEGCSFIKNIGGKIVLAHPNKIRKKNEKLYKELINSDFLDGIEVYHPSITKDTEMELMNIIEEKKLLCTGGTDFHGIYMKNPREIGTVELPDIVIESLEKLMI
ncbi:MULTISPECIES: PHP domain-containing protein [Clostridium]|uniref:PHP domain-containing protein n=1 Tax=Clostridium cadaveris TaxID=1529 RepID=A0A1I2Q2V9_9CLOT|nr:PHP domain-containing protein [Clostridium cadaveris]MDU4951823.1 PHP domain-containing protein [Clostridium sp.]MDM8312052.1 PHP domain-containing protein [Clostridium cadaveris]NME64834.1 PHP domain-containing protein [Clostridium cadaveris]NWK12212.1 PHP domain-containing protein [Clostridium cadaveris]PWL53955.1 MAG: PHP domain-containing protein [Clostridium cadaveris]